MQYLSVCSGIEAATVAWRPLGSKAVAFSEIDTVPNSVLAYHYPTVPNLGNMEKFNEWPRSDIDVLVGGTPCQSFSIAGLRKGMADPRGNLALAFLGVVERFSPRWAVWENVPGVLSSLSHDPPDPSPPIERLGMGCDGQAMETYDEYSAQEIHAFGCFLAGLSELGYGWAYRVLDAQYFGVPQRRRRVFVVGHSSGAWQRAAAVLLERHSLFRHPAPSRKKGPDITNALAARTGGGGRPDGGDGQHSQLIDETAGPLGSVSRGAGQRTTDLDGSGAYVPEIVPQAMSAKWHKGSSGPAGDEHHNLVAEAFKPSHYTRDKDGAPSEIHPPLSADADKGDQEPVVYQCHGNNVGPLGTLRGGHSPGTKQIAGNLGARQAVGRYHGRLRDRQPALQIPGHAARFMTRC